MRLIDADALMESLKESADRAKKWYEDCKTYNSAMIDRAEQAVLTFNECGLRIKEAPTVDAVPVKRGKWDFLGDNQFRCTGCDAFYTGDQFEAIRLRKDDPYEPNFCPNCGADMREEKP